MHMKYRGQWNIVKRREAFGQLVKLLFTLGVTQFCHVPAVSDPFHLFRMPEDLLARLREHNPYL